MTAAEAETLALAIDLQEHPLERATALAQAIELHRQAPEPRSVAVLLGTLGVAYHTAGGPYLASADSVFRLALAARRQLGDSLLIGNALSSIGVVADQRGRSLEATRWHREAYALRLAMRDTVRALQSLERLAGALHKGGRIRAAIAAYDTLIGLQPSADSQARPRIGRQGALSDLARYEEAETDARWILAHAIEKGDSVRTVEAAIDLGRVLLRASLRDESLAVLRPTLKTAETLHRRDLSASIRNNMTIAQMESGRWSAAESLARQAWRDALASDEPSAVRAVAVTRGQLAEHRGRGAEMASWFRRADSARVAHELVECLGDTINLGWAELADGNPEKARHLFVSALERAEQADARDLMWPCLHGLGEVAARRGDDRLALRYDIEATIQVDSVRARQRREGVRVALIDQRFAAYEAVIHRLARLHLANPDSGFGARAFEWAERTRARSLGDLLEAGGHTPPQEGRLSLADVQSRMAPDEALLFYSVGDSSTSLWVLRHDQWGLLRLQPRSRLDPLARGLRAALSSPQTANSARADSLSRVAYRRLLAPAMPWLGGAGTLRIVAAGALASIPFEALRLDSATPGAKPDYAVNRWAISYLPSARWLQGAPHSASSGVVIALGDPDFGDGRAATRGLSRRLSRLPGARAEALALQRVAGPSRTRLLLGRDARWTRAKSVASEVGPDVLHLGTHGEASAERADGIGLWFAPEAGTRPRRVGTDEMLSSGVHARLVTLAACESGLGRVVRGEGVLGLPRVFLANGSGAVLSSLWKTDDAWAQPLFERFYREVLSRNRDPHVALRMAKLAMIDDMGASSPYYWAAFVLAGGAGERSAD